jgi:trimeric autotransporter adhesin
MKAIKQIIVRLVVGCVLALGLISNTYGQIELPPDDGGTNDPPTAEELEAQHQAWLAQLETNRLSVLEWLHDGYTLSDGTPSSFQDIMDQQAMAFSESASGMAAAQQSALSAAWTWAINVGFPPMITNADGITIAALMEIRDGVPLYNNGFAVEAAQTISTDKIWPGGSAGINLDGTSRTLSMWDQGSPRLTHQEFVTNRVTELDGNTTIDLHATAVAGVLVGGGLYDVYIGTPPNNLTNIGRAGKGMSFGANLQARDYFNDTSEMVGAVGTNHTRLSNHSYGRTTGWYQDISGVWYWYGYSEISTNEDPKFGLYADVSSNIDLLIQSTPTYLTVWAAGNSVSNRPPVQPTNHWELFNGQPVYTNWVHPLDGYLGGYDTIAEQACSKNGLTVGAVNPLTNGYAGTNSVVWAGFSSCGPTDDGRIKPDVVAAGVGILSTAGVGDNFYYVPPGLPGTSFSAPSVAGSVNLLVQYYQQLRPDAPELLASTLKDLVIHTADQCGGAPGPNYRFGYGLMNTAGAAGLVANDATNGLRNFIKEVLLNNNQFIQFPLVSVGGTENPVKVTLVWTDPPGSANAETNLNNPAIKLVNDLDLRVVSSGGTTNFPYILNPDLTNRSASVRASAATTGDDDRNNVEQVFIANPATNGTYLVRVTHKGTLSNSQWVSILISGNVAQQPPTLVLNQIIQTATKKIALGWPAVVGQRYQLQTVGALNASNNWQNIGAEVSARLTNTVVELSFSQTNNAFFRLVQLP